MRRVEAMVPQDHAPGAEAEVDFGEVYVILDGVKTKCHMFVYRLSHSGKAIHRVYPTGGQEAFLEGHIEAFHALGGIPTRHIRYDNLTSAVVQVIHGGDRLRDENERWVLFRSHYGFMFITIPVDVTAESSAVGRSVRLVGIHIGPKLIVCGTVPDQLSECGRNRVPYRNLVAGESVSGHSFGTALPGPI